MPRKFLKRYAPNPQRFASKPGIGRLGKSLLNPNLWHLNRRSVSLAVAWGLFCAFLPFPGQMVVAAVGAIFFRINVWISVTLIWVTNPLTIPPIFYGCYRLGAWLMHQEPLSIDWHQPWGEIASQAISVWQPLLLGSLVLGSLFAFLGYMSVRVLWRFHLVTRWRERKHKRSMKP